MNDALTFGDAAELPTQADAPLTFGDYAER